MLVTAMLEVEACGTKRRSCLRPPRRFSFFVGCLLFFDMFVLVVQLLRRRARRRGWPLSRIASSRAISSGKQGRRLRAHLLRRGHASYFERTPSASFKRSG